MTLEQIDSIRQGGEFINLDLTIVSVCVFEGELCINDLVALRLAGCSRSLLRVHDIPIMDISGHNLGSLCLCAGRKFDPSGFTTHQFIAYLIDSETTNPPDEYQFEYDYVVIKKEHLLKYLTTMQHSAPVWGGFVHASRHTAIPNVILSEDSSIVALDNICLPTAMHERLAMRSVSSATPSERFLQLYHQLELLFDWVIVQDIRNLQENLLGVGKVLSRYASGDLHRLQNLLSHYLLSTDNVVKVLGTLRMYENVGQQIFQDYGKEGNPLRDGWLKWISCVKMGDPTDANVKHFKISLDNTGHHGFIIRVTSYFIYRIRCCVAHSKIGEYVLRDTDEEFVVRFAEPLIRTVLKDLLSHPRIRFYAGGQIVPTIS